MSDSPRQYCECSRCELRTPTGSRRHSRLETCATNFGCSENHGSTESRPTTNEGQLSRRRLRLDSGWEVDVKSGAFAGLGMHVHAAARFLQQPVDNGQTQTGALAGRLGGEIGLKNFR